MTCKVTNDAWLSNYVENYPTWSMTRSPRSAVILTIKRNRESSRQQTLLRTSGLAKVLLCALLIQPCAYAETLGVQQTRAMPINELQQKIERNCQCRVISIQNDKSQTVQVRLLLNNGKVVVKKLHSVTGGFLPPQIKSDDGN